jgi:hypothetical protein
MSGTIVIRWRDAYTNGVIATNATNLRDAQREAEEMARRQPGVTFEAVILEDDKPQKPRRWWL